MFGPCGLHFLMDFDPEVVMITDLGPLVCIFALLESLKITTNGTKIIVVVTSPSI